MVERACGTVSRPASRALLVRLCLPLTSLALPVACGEDVRGTNGSQASPEPSGPVDRTSSADLLFEVPRSGLETFLHRRFMTPEKKYLPETAGSGVALLDTDGDGRLDVYFVQCCPLPGNPIADPKEPNRLYRNLGGLQFEDVTARAGVGDTGYGMGATAPDLDDDGFPELYVTNVFANVLYRNRGDGTFEDETERSGLGDPTWSTAAGWIDYDRDGDLDLYLANYAVVDFEHYEPCSVGVGSERIISYCHPDTLVAVPDRFLRNEGDRRFVDVTAAAGIVDRNGRGLAVVPFDHDDDGLVDLFVANDASDNFLWHNLGGERFEDIAPDVCVDVSAEGKSQSCMGTDIDDIDGDGDFDIFSANFSKEHNVLYLRVNEDYYDDAILKSGMGAASYDKTGFGARFFDVDRDGDLDLLVVNGHIVDVVELVSTSETFLQDPQLFLNRGNGTFEEVSTAYGAYFRRKSLGRGLAVGDLDDDGDLDAVISLNDARPVLLENRAFPERHFVGVRLIGSKSPRDPIGARVTLTCGDQTQLRELRATSSYLSWQDLRLHFGLGDRTTACTAKVRWPSGQEQVFEDLAVDRYHVLEER